MFVGHYGPAGALAHGRLRLWHCFVAVQFLDILWAPFVLAGIEHVRIMPNFTASNHFDLYHMPWTHSLVMAVAWSVLASLGYRLLARSTGAAATFIGLLVFSHWALDFLTHKPDLELWFGGPKVGLGLWDNRPLSFGLELALFLGGMTLYWLRSAAKNVAGRVMPALLIILGLAAQYYGNWGPPPASGSEAAMSALVAYAIFAGLALMNDLTRSWR